MEFISFAMKDILSKKGADKVAMFLLLLAMVAAAYILVEKRSKVELGTPVELEQAGLSVRPPQGELWQCENQWKYSNFYFQLLCRKVNPNQKGGTVITYRYNLYGSEKKGAEQLQEDYSEYGILRKGAFGDDPEISWVSFMTKQPFIVRGNRVQYQTVNRVAALADLGQSRQLEIMIETTGSIESAQNLIKAISKGVTYCQRAEIERGIEFTDNFLRSNFVNNPGSGRVFLIKDSNDNPLGFSLESRKMSTLNQERSIFIKSYDFVSSNIPYTNASTLNYVDGFKKFEMTGRRERQTGQEVYIHEISYDHPKLTLTALGTQNEALKDDQSVSLDIWNRFIADQFFVEAGKFFCGNMTEPIVVDFFEAQGKLVPTRMEKLDEQANGCVLRMSSLDQSNSVNHVYYDRYGNFVELINVTLNYKIELSNKREIEKLFPMWDQLIESYDTN